MLCKILRLNPPKLNPEIQLRLSESEGRTDTFLSHIQVNLGKGASAVGTTL